MSFANSFEGFCNIESGLVPFLDSGRLRVFGFSGALCFNKTGFRSGQIPTPARKCPPTSLGGCHAPWNWHFLSDAPVHRSVPSIQQTTTVWGHLIWKWSTGGVLGGTVGGRGPFFCPTNWHFEEGMKSVSQIHVFGGVKKKVGLGRTPVWLFPFSLN